MLREEHSEGKWQLPFVLYKPTEETDNLPIIFILHGRGERGVGGEELKRVESYDFVQRFQKEEYPCIMVFPQCPENSFWVAELQKLKDFILSVQKEYGADKERTYLAGLSMGGYGTWYTAMAYPKLFAAIAPVCGGGMPWNADVLNMPIWAFHGSEDDRVLPSESMNMIQSIRKVGTNQDVKLTIVDNVAHEVWNIAFTEELISWLLSK